MLQSIPVIGKGSEGYSAQDEICKKSKEDYPAKSQTDVADEECLSDLDKACLRPLTPLDPWEEYLERSGLKKTLTCKQDIPDMPCQDRKALYTNKERSPRGRTSGEKPKNRKRGYNVPCTPIQKIRVKTRMCLVQLTRY